MMRQRLVTIAVGLLALGILSAPMAGAGSVSSGQGFADALRAAGWDVEVMADGSLELSPASMPVAVEGLDAPQSPNEAPDQTPDQTPAARTTAPVVQPGDWSVLRDFGWRVETDADGSTLLYPHSAAPAPMDPKAEPSLEPEVAEPTLPDAQAEVARDLDALLAERGWRARREADGTLLLLPLSRGSDAAATLEPGAGTLSRAISEGRVTLPVDTWDKARAITLTWLESLGDPALRLGKIRRVHRVYLVSIVADAPPHGLLHQIAIGVDDGRIRVLN